MSKSAVAITRGSNYNELIRGALSLLDVASRLKNARKVLIKPNLVRTPPEIPIEILPYEPAEPAPYSLYANMGKSWCRTVAPDGDITRTESVEALLKYLQELGVKNVTVAEASGGWDTELAYRCLGYKELAEKYGAKLVDMNWTDCTKVAVPKGHAMKEFWVPNVVLESDFRINLTTLKVHGTAISLCLKNWGIGIPPGKYYGFNKSANRILGLLGPGAFPIHHHFDDEKIYGQGIGTAKAIADVCSAIPYELGIIDGLTTVHREKLAPKAKMVVEKTNLMLASYDMVSIDAVAARVMGFYPHKILHIYLCEEMGLGTADLNKIEILGLPIKDVEMRCNPQYGQRSLMIT